MIRAFTLFVLLGTLGSCSSYSRQLVPLPAQESELVNREGCRVYVARDEGWRRFPRDILVYDGELAIGTLAQETYLCWERGAGAGVLRTIYKDHKLAEGDYETRFEIEFEAGTVYYFHIAANPEADRPTFQPMGEEEGRELIGRRRSPDSD